jgi:threonine aldolase
MRFASDNATRIHPKILEAITEANHGYSLPYGADAATAEAKRMLCEVFEADLEVAFVPTGTAANSLALSLLASPVSAIVCRSGAHIEINEAGGASFYSGGARVVGIPGDDGRLSSHELAWALSDFDPVRQFSRPAVLSLTQATELGTVYTVEQVAALVEVAKHHKLGVHMDGARFANAVASLGCTPAEMSWKVGVDVLSLGATKNGALAVEAVLLFDRRLAADMCHRAKRGGLVLSKQRFLAAQFLAYLRDGLWINLAATANSRAQELARALAATGRTEIVHAVESNHVFARFPEAVVDALEKRGALFYRRGGGLVRLVTSFETTAAEIEQFVAEVAAADSGNSIDHGAAP